MLFCPYEPFRGGGVKNKKNIFKMYFFFGVFMTPMTLFRHIWMTNGCQIQNQRTKLPLGAQIPEKWHMMSSKVIDLGWPRKGQNVSVNHGCHLATPSHVHITSKNTELRKFQALKRYGTQISLDMNLEIRSQVKSHSRYGLEIFRNDVK